MKGAYKSNAANEVPQRSKLDHIWVDVLRFVAALCCAEKNCIIYHKSYQAVLIGIRVLLLKYNCKTYWKSNEIATCLVWKSSKIHDQLGTLYKQEDVWKLVPAVSQKEKRFIVVNAANAVSDEAEHAESSKSYLLTLHWATGAKHNFNDWNVS